VQIVIHQKATEMTVAAPSAEGSARSIQRIVLEASSRCRRPEQAIALAEPYGIPQAHDHGVVATALIIFVNLFMIIWRMCE
jgi:hypothetical protein